MSEPTYAVNIRATHPYGFRSGEWATVIGLTWMNGRASYVVMFLDGKVDQWPINDPWDPYEMRAGRPAVVAHGDRR